MISTRRIIAHFWMWGIIAAGLILVYLNIPVRNIQFFERQGFLPLMILLLVVFLIYYLVSIIYYYFKYSLTGSRMEKLVTYGVYGRRVHPTCTTIAILVWGAFIVYPETRIFFADVWITSVVFFWIRMEKAVYGKKKKVIDDESDPD